MIRNAMCFVQTMRCVHVNMQCAAAEQLISHLARRLTLAVNFSPAYGCVVSCLAS